MRLLQFFLTIGVIAIVATIGGCGRKGPAEDAPLSTQSDDLSKALGEASRTDSHPVYRHYLTRFRSEVTDLENRVTALYRAADNLKGRPDKAAVVNAIVDFEKLVHTSRAELEAFEKGGPSPDWEDARNRTQRAIASAKSSFDGLALRYGVTKVAPDDRK
jgi:predicted small lipoprotein YifL